MSCEPLARCSKSVDCQLSRCRAGVAKCDYHIDWGCAGSLQASSATGNGVREEHKHDGGIFEGEMTE